METPFSSGSFLSTQFMSGNQMQYFPDRGYLTQPEMGNFRQTPGPQYPQALNQLGFMGAMFHGYLGTNTLDNYVMGADSHKFGLMARRKVQDSSAAIAGSILDNALKMVTGAGATALAAGSGPVGWGALAVGAAVGMMTPGISSPFNDRLRQARNIQYQTMGKVIGGSDMDQGLGQGFSLQAAGRMDQSIRRMAASDPMLKEKDYRKMMEMGIEGGMFDYSLSSAQYTGKLKNLIGNFKAMMEMLETADPKLIQDTMTRLQRMGASTDQMIPMVAKEQLAARMLGIQHSEMINTYGQQGAMLYGAAGLTPYAGTHENVGNVANAALAQRLGLIDPSRMARLGGIGAIGQRGTQETANLLNSTAAQGIMYTMLDSNMDFDPSKLGEMLASNEDMRGRLNKGMQAYSDMTKNNTLKHVQMQKKMATNKAKLGEYLSQEGLADEYKMKLYESVGATVDPALDYWGRVEMGMWAISELPPEQQDTQLKIWKSPEFQKQLKNQKQINKIKQNEGEYNRKKQAESVEARFKVFLSGIQNTVGDYLYGKSTDWHEKTDGLFGTKPPAYVNSWEGGMGSVFGRGSSGGTSDSSGRNLIREITGKEPTREEMDLFMEVMLKEAGGLPKEGQVAVARSIIERLRYPKEFRDTLGGVIMQPMQYSSMTDPDDPQYKKKPKASPEAYKRMQEIIDGVVSGEMESPTPEATMFHDDRIKKGHFTSKYGATYLDQIKNMIFYKGNHAETPIEPQYGPRVPTPKRPVNRLGQMDMSWVNDKAPVEFRAAKATWMEARSVGSQVKGMGTPTGDYRGQSRESIITALIDAANASGATTAAALESTVIEELSVLMGMRSADVMADPELSKLIEIALSRTRPHVQDILKGSAQRYNVKNTENYIRGINKVQNESLGKINELATNTYGGGIRDMLGKPQTSNALEVLTALTMHNSLKFSKREDLGSNKTMLGHFKKATGLDGLTEDILSDQKKLGEYLKQQGWTDGDIEVVTSAADAKSQKIRGDKKAYDSLNNQYFDAKKGYAKGVVVSEEAELELGLRNVAGITEDGSLIDKLFNGDAGKQRTKGLMENLGTGSKAYGVLEEILSAKSKEEFLNTTRHLNDLDDAARGKGNVPSEGRNNEPTKVEQDQLDLGKQTKDVLGRLDSTLTRVETELKIMNDKKVGPFKHKYNLVEGLTE